MRPRIHVTPVNNWMNDPNGFIYYRNKYHLYYQYFPYDTKWGTTHWGHKTSDDLVHWKEEGIALYPSKWFDRNGCFSGSSIIIDDKLYVYYTAVIYDKLNEENIHISGDGLIASQVLVTSEDAYYFNPDDKRIVIPSFDEDSEIGSVGNTRDPKVFQIGDTYYIVVGSQYSEKGESDKLYGSILFYTSKDGKNWDYRYRLSDKKIDSYMFECPDLFRVNDTNVLIMSPEGILNDGINYPSHATWSIVDFDPKTCETHFIKYPEYLDYGLDLYAPQTTIDQEGNRVLMAWLRMPMPSDDGDYIGLYILPRVIEFKNNRLYTNVHPNVDRFFSEEVDTYTGNTSKIVSTLKEGGYIDIGGYRIEYKNHRLYTNREKVFTDAAKLFNNDSQVGKRFSTPEINECRVNIYVDEQVIEVYINEGEYVISNIVYNLGDTLDSNVDLQVYELSDY